MAANTALERLGEGDARDVHTRGQRHTVLQAINRPLSHAYHGSQIVMLAKHFHVAE